MNSQVAKILLLSFALITHVQAEDLPLEHTETVVSVPPNVFMSVDNSGSMRFNYAMNREWTIDTYTDYNPSLYTATYPIRYYQSSFKHDWRSLSSDFNTLAYNPNKKYQPWPGYPDANYDKVRYHPDPSHTDNYNKILNLNTDVYIYDDYTDLKYYNGFGFEYTIWKDVRGYTGNAPKPDQFNSRKRGNRNTKVDLWDDYTLVKIKDNKFEVTKYEFSPVKSKLSESNIHECDFFYEDNEFLYEYYKSIGDAENRDIKYNLVKNSTNGFEECLGRQVRSHETLNKYRGRTVEQEKQNIANWFQYHRTRHLAVNSMIASLVEKFPTFHYGLLNFPIATDVRPTWGQYGERFFMPVRKDNEDQDQYNRTMLDKLFKNTYPAGHTPLAETMIHVGEYFKGNIDGYESPVELSCKQNYHFLLTDGGRNEEPVINNIISDHDKDGYSDYSGFVSLADIASYYYNVDLLPDSKNNVPIAGNYCASDVIPVAHQHLVISALSYGIPPKQSIDSALCWPESRPDTNGDWLNPGPELDTGYHPNSIDDLWHAAYNSRGNFMSVRSVDEALKKLSHNFKNILQRSFFYGKGEVDRYKVTTGSYSYQASFDVAERWGEIKAFAFNETNGRFDSRPKWSVGGVSQPPLEKDTILTYNSENDKGMALIFDNLNDSQKKLLFTRNDEDELDDDEDEDEDEEFMEEFNIFIQDLQTRPLGTLTNTNLVVSAKPKRRTYTLSEKDNKDKIEGIKNKLSEYIDNWDIDPVLYFGSNDGMLHAVQAENANPLFSYVPSQVLHQGLVHYEILGYQSFVDGELVVKEAYDGGNWNTVLVGGLRFGGKGYYALNVNAPESMTATEVLWEIDDKHADHGDDIGYSYSRPAVGFFNDGKSYAVVGNGLNSKNGKAVLYIIDITTGTVVHNFESYGRDKDPTQLGRPNSFSEPKLLDVDGDSTIDRIYVGDFFGHLYAFNVSSSNSNNWKSFNGSNKSSKPIVMSSVVNHAPITSRPEIVSQFGSDDLTVVYGTGELFTQDKGRDFDHFLVGVKHSKNDEDAKTTITNRSTFNRHTVERNGSNYWSIVPKGAEQDEDAQGWTIALKSTMNTQPPEILYGKSIWLLNDVKTKNNVVSCTSAVVDSHYLVFNPFTGLGFKNPVFSAEDGEEVVADGITVSGDIRNLQVIDTNNGHDIVVPVGSNISVNLGNLNLGRRTWFKY